MNLLRDQVLGANMRFSASFFDNIVHVYTESQSWTLLNELLESVDHDTCSPSDKTLRLMKTNMMYCFDSTQRTRLQANIDNFDSKFFKH